MNIQADRLSQNHTVDNFVCTECYQANRIQKLVIIDGTVVCPADPAHTSHIRESIALAQLGRDRRLAQRVIRNYPQLNPNPLHETAQESIDALFP